MCSYDRVRMIAGAAAAQICFANTTTLYGGLLPSSIDGRRLPPAGAPNYIVALGASSPDLAYWRFHSDFTTPANSTFTLATTLTPNAYTPLCPATSNCVPQLGTADRLDALADRGMFRNAYRNFGDHEALVVNHAVDVSGGTASGVRWYEIRGPFNAPHVVQQSTYAPGTTARWMGSAAMDKQGNLLVGYSASSSAQFPAIMLAGRSAADTPGKLSKEMVGLKGSAAQQDFERWGDYASMTVDPTDDCTFWFTTELMDQNHRSWQTSIVHTKFKNCT